MALQRQPERERRLSIVEPEHRLGSWFDDMDRFYNRMLRRFGMLSGRRESMWSTDRALWMPDVDVMEKNNQMIVRADLPGMKREDIHLTVENDTLVISGSRKEEREEKQEGYYFAERSIGEFRRAIPLPEGADTDKIDASYKDGVLEARVPLPAASAQKRKEIKVA